MYSLRVLKDVDINLVQSWLSQDYIKKWFGDPIEWLEEIKGRNNKYSFIHHFIMEKCNKPIGFCQYYDYNQLPFEVMDQEEPDGTYGIDYLIGEKSSLGKGIGKCIVKLICDKAMEENGNIFQIVADPTIEEGRINIASIKVLEANQFHYDENAKLYKKIL